MDLDCGVGRVLGGARDLLRGRKGTLGKYPHPMEYECLELDLTDGRGGEWNRSSMVGRPEMGGLTWSGID